MYQEVRFNRRTEAGGGESSRGSLAQPPQSFYVCSGPHRHVGLSNMFSLVGVILSYLSSRWLKNGKVELGVHIADVSHFVKPGSLTDLEARFRFVLQSFSCTVIVVDGDKGGAVACVVDESFASHFQYMKCIFNR